MEYRRLGNSGLWVSPICLGTMMFGLRTTPAVAARIMDKARAAGVNFIDTADQYAKGKSEEIVGRLIAKDRDDWVLATKVATTWSDRPNEAGTGRKWLTRELDSSLKRLKTDYIDLYYLHKDDTGTPMEETVFALGDAIRAGKIRSRSVIGRSATSRVGAWLRPARRRTGSACRGRSPASPITTP